MVPETGVTGVNTTLGAGTYGGGVGEDGKHTLNLLRFGACICWSEGLWLGQELTGVDDPTQEDDPEEDGGIRGTGDGDDVGGWSSK